MRDTELNELEDEFEDEAGLQEDESEGIIGAIGNALGSLLSESASEHEVHEHEHHEHEHHEHAFGEHGFGEHAFGEMELEDEHAFGEHAFGEMEYEDEHAFGEHAFGEMELEDEHAFGEMEFEDEHAFGEHAFGEMELEDEHGEHFFKGIGRFIRRAAPLLKRIAKVAFPLVSTAVGGPLGGMLGKVATSALGEGEIEGEFEIEGEMEAEVAHELEATLVAPLTEHQAMAELMAAVAAEAQTEAEAEAMIGAATLQCLSPHERRELRRVLAHLVRGSAILTRLLRRRRLTRPAVRAVPAIVHATAHTLTRRAAAGQPVTRRAAGRVMAAHTRRVLANPHVCGRAIQRNVRASRTVQARRAIPTASYRPTPVAVRRARAAARVAPRPAVRSVPRRRVVR